MSRYRRSRLAGGTFFFTAALEDRSSQVLVERIEDLRSVYRRVQASRSFETIAICVLPDHLHAIWRLPEGDADFSSRWNWLKGGFSRQIPAAGAARSKLDKREKGIWQRRFWEHRIRDEDDLQRHVDYIHFNPVKHGLVNRVRDWPHSSLHRYVKAGWVMPDWGGDAGGEMAAGEP